MKDPVELLKLFRNNIFERLQTRSAWPRQDVKVLVDRAYQDVLEEIVGPEEIKGEKSDKSNLENH
jgi:hypothetical protein